MGLIGVMSCLSSSRTAQGRRAALRDARRKLEEQRAAKTAGESEESVESRAAALVELDAEEIVGRVAR